MPKLCEACLCGNEMTTLLAEDLARLRELHTLYLGGNKLAALSMELFNLNWLVVIDMSNNDLRYNVNTHELDWNWNYDKSLQQSGTSIYQATRVSQSKPATDPLESHGAVTGPNTARIPSLVL
ncbi:hypothetical protein P691DRAFT_812143 [Macrolepiota fuliginosa MF-IS2]|uniref:Uncharacterized protein n=1 Tax=Macrolepiota fuliginosa MF-IS2 TaxID=1400762 RepID=A0A9P6C592_9AGAR|nr:hypothetical protein P691DRAFT_812143 [Macrolepiota fuliginosa MF-IS2]